MRILFLESHPMWIHGLPNGFRDAGHQVKISGPLSKDSIVRLLRGFKPQLIISLGWTDEHNQDKQKLVRKYVKPSGIPHVYWATEDPTHFLSFTLPYVLTVKPDFVFTICKARIKDYANIGIPAAHMDFGFHPIVHRTGRSSPRFKSSIAVVANGYTGILEKYPQHYRIQSLRHLIKPLVQDGTRIDIWGRQWDMMRPVLGVKVPRNWIHGYLDYPDARKVYNSAKIVLGPQNQLTQVTQRTYEILASGGFLITSDTPVIRRLFRPGRDLVVTRSANQTRQLIRYYLNHPWERKKIQMQGLTAVQRHHYKYRAAYMLALLKKHHIIP
ncbi:CgeB family protein [Paenibacillus sp. YAF4_2]|uniref:CgeB family protein n=1 Tax=Paenibacillus sp. YAF4_2 TaxID=3233085 RepID=UPI003F9C1DEE